MQSFDRINHPALLRKLDTSPCIRRQIHAWLKAGVVDDGELFPTNEGTPQGGVASPLLANIALHGLEQIIEQAFARKKDSPKVIRYADDLVVLHQDRAAIEKCQQIISEWLAGIGLELKPDKTRITHTLEVDEGKAGFDFLGFNIRQYRVGKRKSGLNPGTKQRLGFKTIIKPSKKSLKRHCQRMGEVIDQNRMAQQAKLIIELGRIIRGWSNYYSRVCSKTAYSKADRVLLTQLRRWVRYRHPGKSRLWAARKYWKREGGRMYFSPKKNRLRLRFHSETRIKRHVKVQGGRSPYDRDWVYWSTRLGQRPDVSTRVGKLLKRQEGRCSRCGQYCKDGDVLEVDHIIAKELGGVDAYYNWQLLHGHCHDEKTREESRRCE